MGLKNASGHGDLSWYHWGDCIFWNLTDWRSGFSPKCWCTSVIHLSETLCSWASHSSRCSDARSILVRETSLTPHFRDSWYSIHCHTNYSVWLSTPRNGLGPRSFCLGLCVSVVSSDWFAQDPFLQTWRPRTNRGIMKWDVKEKWKLWSLNMRISKQHMMSSRRNLL